MSKSHHLPIAGLVLLLGAAPAVLFAQRDRVERHVFVGVTGSDGKPVAALGPADLIVREDDVAQEVIAVDPAPPPSHIALLVDDSSATQQMVVDLRGGLNSFVASLSTLSTPPAVSLRTFGERPTKVTDFSTSVPIVARAIQRIVPRPGSGAYFLDALIDACRDLTAAHAERPVIVAFVSEDGPEFSERSHQEISKALASAHASLWVAALKSARPSDSEHTRERAIVIGGDTAASGGMEQLILSKEGITHGFETIATALLNRYDVTYGRPDSMIPPSRLSVEAHDRSLHVAAPTTAGAAVPRSSSPASPAR